MAASSDGQPTMQPMGFTSGGMLVTGEHWQQENQGGAAQRRRMNEMGDSVPGSQDSDLAGSAQQWHISVPAQPPTAAVRTTRMQRWRCTVQGARWPSKCNICSHAFAEGAVRICSARARVTPRYVHAGCLAKKLGVPDEVAGLSALSQEQLESVTPYLDIDDALPDNINDHDSDEQSVGHDGTLKNLSWWTNEGNSLADAYVGTDALLLNQAASLTDVPGSLQLAIGEAREAVAQAVLAAATPELELGAWRCFLAFDRMLFGELKDGTDHEQRRSVADRVSARLHDFWEGRWGVLMRDTTIPARSVGSSASQGQTVRKVRKLLLKGEIAKATSSAWGPAKLRGVRETLDAFAAQQSEDATVLPAPSGPPADGVAAQHLRDDVLNYLFTHWDKTPKGSGCGVQADRFEHWRPLATIAGQGSATATVLARLVGGDVPAEALDVVLSGKLLGFAKKDDGTRVLACGTVARRMVARAVCAVRKDKILEVVTDMQFGVSIPSGVEALHKSMSARAEEHPDMAYVSLDMKSAFTRMRRRSVLRNVRKLCPELEPFFQQWYARSTIHVAAGGASESRVITQVDGLDQGCPLSPAFFCIGMAPALLEFRGSLQRLDSRCRVWAYLDDVYFSVPKGLLEQGAAAARHAFGAVGLELNVPKTRLWCPDAVIEGLPAAWAPLCADKLPCLGSALTFVRPRDDGDGRDVCVGIHDDESPSAAVQRLERYSANLFCLGKQGLEAQHCFTLLRTYVNGAVTHLQRARLASDGAWRVFDDAVVHAMEGLMGQGITGTSRALLFLPAKLGGLGLQSAECRADAAWLASWHAVKHMVRDCQDGTGEQEREAATPFLSRAVITAIERLRDRGVALARGGRAVMRQSAMVKQIHREQKSGLMAGLGADEASHVRSGADTGAAVLQPPRRAEHLLSDDEFIITVRCRLLMIDPAGSVGEPCANQRVATRTPCAVIDNHPHAKHALDCPIGGGPTIRHDFCKDGLAGWLEEHHGKNTVQTEQRIPQWDRVTAEGPQLAILDVVFSPIGGRVAVDVSVTDVLAASDAEARARARADGVAARERERQKHRRYPGPGLVAGVIETGGRLGREFEAFLKEHAPRDPSVRLLALADVKQRLGAALARGNAAMLLSSAGRRARPWPALGQIGVASRRAP